MSHGHVCCSTSLEAVQPWSSAQFAARPDPVGHAPPARSQPAIAAELKREEFWAIRDVSFEVKPGETLGIIGGNGAGKSTTLKLLTHILQPTRGIAQSRGRVGALIEVSAGFHLDLTGRENVFLQGAIMGMSQALIRERFDDIVEFSGIRAVHRHAGEALQQRHECAARLLHRGAPRA